MAKYFCLLSTVIVTSSFSLNVHSQILSNFKIIKINTKNDAKNDWRVDEDTGRNQREFFINNGHSQDLIARKGLQTLSKINEQLSTLQDLIQYGVKYNNKHSKGPLQISLQSPKYNDIPSKANGNPFQSDKSFESIFLNNIFRKNSENPNVVQQFQSNLGVARERNSWSSYSLNEVNPQQLISASNPKKIVKRMSQQETKAKKLKKLKRARDKRRRKMRKRLKYLRKIGKAPKKKGDGGKNKVKKVYKRFRKGNSTHSFYKTTTERIKIKSETIEEPAIPRWVPDGGNSTENITSEQLGKNDIEAYDASTVESSDESEEESSDDESYDESGNKSEEEDEEEHEDTYESIADENAKENQHQGKKGSGNKKFSKIRTNENKHCKHDGIKDKIQFNDIKNGITDNIKKGKEIEEHKQLMDEIVEKQESKKKSLKYVLNKNINTNPENVHMKTIHTNVEIKPELTSKNFQNPKEISSKYLIISKLHPHDSKEDVMHLKDKYETNMKANEMNSIYLNPNIKITIKTNIFKEHGIQKELRPNLKTEKTYSKYISQNINHKNSNINAHKAQSDENKFKHNELERVENDFNLHGALYKNIMNNDKSRKNVKSKFHDTEFEKLPNIKPIDLRQSFARV